MNPLCQCGCGQEVLHPDRRFLVGHQFKRMLSETQVEKLLSLRSEGWSYARIGKEFGVSPTAVIRIVKEGYRPKKRPRSEPVRQEDIEAQRRSREASRPRKLLMLLKKELRLWLKEMRCQGTKLGPYDADIRRFSEYLALRSGVLKKTGNKVAPVKAIGPFCAPCARRGREYIPATRKVSDEWWCEWCWKN